MFNNKMEGYYQEMAELQEKLRKSEQDRFRLEEKFTEMMRLTRDTEQERLRSLRHKYNKFIEEDRRRQERNAEIFRTLERIEARAATIAAKTNRYKHLREQYAVFLKNKQTSTYDKQNTIYPQERNLQYSPTCRRKLFPEDTRDESYDNKIAKSKINMLEQYIKENNETEKFLNNIANKITDKNIPKPANYDNILEKIIRNTTNQNLNLPQDSFFEPGLQIFPRYQFEENLQRNQLQKDENVREYLSRIERYAKEQPIIKVEETKDEIDFAKGYESDVERTEKKESPIPQERKESLIKVQETKKLEEDANSNEVQEIPPERTELQEQFKMDETRNLEDYPSIKVEASYFPPQKGELGASSTAVNLPQELENLVQNGVPMVEEVEKTLLNFVLSNQNESVKIVDLQETKTNVKDFPAETPSVSHYKDVPLPAPEINQKEIEVPKHLERNYENYEVSELINLGLEQPKELDESQIVEISQPYDQQGFTYQEVDQSDQNVEYENQILEDQYFEEQSNTGELQQENQYAEEQIYDQEQTYKEEQKIQEESYVQEQNYTQEQNLDQGEVYVQEQEFVEEQNYSQYQNYTQAQNYPKEEQNYLQYQEQNYGDGQEFVQEPGYDPGQGYNQQNQEDSQDQQYGQDQQYNQDQQGYNQQNQEDSQDQQYGQDQQYKQDQQGYNQQNQEDSQDQQYGQDQQYNQDQQGYNQQNQEDSQDQQYGQDQQYNQDQQYIPDQQYNEGQQYTPDQQYTSNEQYNQDQQYAEDQQYAQDQQYHQDNQDPQYQQEYLNQQYTEEQYDPSQQHPEGYDQQYDPSYQNYEYQQEKLKQNQYQAEEYQQNLDPNQQYVENPPYDENYTQNYEQTSSDQGGQQQVEYAEETVKQDLMEDSISSAENVGNIDTILGGNNEEPPITKANLGKFLESDTESSLKQDTKVSNDSDFDFSQNN